MWFWLFKEASDTKIKLIDFETQKDQERGQMILCWVIILFYNEFQDPFRASVITRLFIIFFSFVLYPLYIAWGYVFVLCLTTLESCFFLINHIFQSYISFEMLVLLIRLQCILVCEPSSLQIEQSRACTLQPHGLG